MVKSIVVAGKRVKLDNLKGSVLIKGVGVVTIQIDQFVTLADFLKIARTAEEIKKSYALNSTVAAKRLVAEAIRAGVKISKYPSTEPRDSVGRQPNLYQLTEFVTPPETVTETTVRPIDVKILDTLKSISTRMDTYESRSYGLPRGVPAPHVISNAAPHT